MISTPSARAWSTSWRIRAVFPSRSPTTAFIWDRATRTERSLTGHLLHPHMLPANRVTVAARVRGAEPCSGGWIELNHDFAATRLPGPDHAHRLTAATELRLVVRGESRFEQQLVVAGVRHRRLGPILQVA